MAYTGTDTTDRMGIVRRIRLAWWVITDVRMTELKYAKALVSYHETGAHDG